MLNSCNKDEWKNQNKSISALWVASLSFRDEEKKLCTFDCQHNFKIAYKNDNREISTRNSRIINSFFVFFF